MSAMIKTELGLEVQTHGALVDYREHTAERWRERDREKYDNCLALIRLGVVDQSELARQFGVSRNSIQAMMMAEFTIAELNSLKAKASAIATLQGLDKIIQLQDKAISAKELGAVAMSVTAANNISQLASGGPTEIKRVEHLVSIEDFQLMKQAPPIIDVMAGDRETL